MGGPLGMLTEEDDVEIHALARRGWSVSAIARHTGRDRKTVRKYLTGARPMRAPAPSCLEPFREYVVARFVDDAHVDGTVLYREVTELGFERSYVTFVRELRRLGLRPRCEACRTGGHGATVELVHESGEEIQFDWLELTERARLDHPHHQPRHRLLGRDLRRHHRRRRHPRPPPAPRHRASDRRRQLPHARPPRPPHPTPRRPQPGWGNLAIATEEFPRSLTAGGDTAAQM